MLCINRLIWRNYFHAVNRFPSGNSLFCVLYMLCWRCLTFARWLVGSRLQYSKVPAKVTGYLQKDIDIIHARRILKSKIIVIVGRSGYWYVLVVVVWANTSFTTLGSLQLYDLCPRLQNFLQLWKIGWKSKKTFFLNVRKFVGSSWISKKIL